jgi:hypothetical protein
MITWSLFALRNGGAIKRQTGVRWPASARSRRDLSRRIRPLHPADASPEQPSGAIPGSPGAVPGSPGTLAENLG